MHPQILYRVLQAHVETQTIICAKRTCEQSPSKVLSEVLHRDPCQGSLQGDYKELLLRGVPVFQFSDLQKLSSHEILNRDPQKTACTGVLEREVVTNPCAKVTTSDLKRETLQRSCAEILPRYLVWSMEILQRGLVESPCKRVFQRALAERPYRRFVKRPFSKTRTQVLHQATTKKSSR